MATNEDIGTGGDDSNGLDIKFSHVQLYVDRLAPFSEYKRLEAKLVAFHDSFERDDCGDGTGGDGVLPEEDALTRGRRLWKSLHTVEEEDEAFVPHGRDVVKQLMSGFGFRVTGCYPDVSDARMDSTSSTNSVLVTSNDPDGIQILITAANEYRGSDEATSERYLHFDATNVEKFYNAHSKRQGIAVLAFEVGKGCLDRIFDRYSTLHPSLLPGEYADGAKAYDGEAWVLEVYAYYKGEKGASSADEGTRLRFVEPETMSLGGKCKLPGIAPVAADFRSCRPAYFDHWVSNVVSRTGFLDTLEDVLSFTPKVDFNAGVVAAGEAQIESTVTGNSSAMTTTEKNSALKDQSQIYLPINNAITNVGHVHGFLKEIGQGVQHIASRVGNIIEFVQEANDRRKLFGEGFTFLNIPRSYYGILTKGMLVKGLPKMDDIHSPEKESLSLECASVVYDVCVLEGLLNDDCSLVLDSSEDMIGMTIASKIPTSHEKEFTEKRNEIVKTIMHSRYANLYNLLRDHLSEESYVAIVRNQILVDVQGEDLLFQIFTSNILQRKSGDEAPFFEFIQRVCSECMGPDGCPKKLKPGCGGFGIRNFLTLFLSIEVTKAMLEASNAKERGDFAMHAYAQRKVDLFTDQLNESNPLLTEISDAMTLEGIARDKLTASSQEEKKDDGDMWRLEMEKQSLAKARANDKLMLCNKKYQLLMKELRESQNP